MSNVCYVCSVIEAAKHYFHKHHGDLTIIDTVFRLS
jgi:hypothetical protein